MGKIIDADENGFPVKTSWHPLGPVLSGYVLVELRTRDGERLHFHMEPPKPDAKPENMIFPQLFYKVGRDGITIAANQGCGVQLGASTPLPFHGQFFKGKLYTSLLEKGMTERRLCYLAKGDPLQIQRRGTKCLKLTLARFKEIAQGIADKQVELSEAGRESTAVQAGRPYHAYRPGVRTTTHLLLPSVPAGVTSPS